MAESWQAPRRLDDSHGQDVSLVTPPATLCIASPLTTTWTRDPHHTDVIHYVIRRRNRIYLCPMSPCAAELLNEYGICLLIVAYIYIGKYTVTAVKRFECNGIMPFNNAIVSLYKLFLLTPEFRLYIWSNKSKSRINNICLFKPHSLIKRIELNTCPCIYRYSDFT